MPWIRLNNFEYAGFLADINAHLLPPNTVSRLENAHCTDGVLENYMGQTQYPYTPDANPLLSLLSGGFTTPWLLGMTEDSIYSLGTTAATDVTPGGGLSTVLADNNPWTGGVLHGLGILNNGVDAPLYWNESAVAALTNWISGETCKTLRVFKNFLFAGNIDDGSDSYPTKVRWSTAADPGALPASWDDSDPTNDAGSFTISETPGSVLDFLAVGESLFVYKDDMVSEINYIGGVFIFKQTPRFKSFGLLNRNCAIEHRGAAYALGQDDIVIHNRDSMQSIATKQIRRRLFNGMSNSYKGRSFVAWDAANAEILFCVPWNSDTPDHAFTYSPADKKWGERDLIPSYFAGIGRFNYGDWDSDSGTWDTDSSAWGSGLGGTYKTFLAGDKLGLLNDTFQLNGVDIVTVMERQAIDFGEQNNANERIKFISHVRPNIVADAGTQVSVQIGTQMRLGDAVSWSTARTFTVGTDRDLCFRENGRYISWRVTGSAQVLWRLESLDVDVRLGALW